MKMQNVKWESEVKKVSWKWGLSTHVRSFLKKELSQLDLHKGVVVNTSQTNLQCSLFVNCRIIQTLSQGLLGVYIQDGGRFGPAAILGFKTKKTQGRSLAYSQQMLENALLWTLQDMLPSMCTEEVAEAWRELFRFIGATMMRGQRRAYITWPSRLPTQDNFHATNVRCSIYNYDCGRALLRCEGQKDKNKALNVFFLNQIYNATLKGYMQEVSRSLFTTTKLPRTSRTQTLTDD